MSLAELYWVLAQTHLAFLGLAVVIGLVRYKRLDRVGRFFEVFLCFLFSILLASLILAAFNIRNHFLSPVELVTEALLIGLWFPMALIGIGRKRTAQVLGIALLVIIVAEMFDGRPPEELKDVAALMKCLFVASCASLGILGLMGDDRIGRFSRRPDFWFFIGLLVTNAFSCFFNAFRSELLGYSMDAFTFFACLELLLQISAFVLYAYIFKYLY